MNADNVWLGIAENRLQFWRGHLQDAFRDGNTERVIVCQHMIAEYSQVTCEAMTQLQKWSQSAERLSRCEQDRLEPCVAGTDVRLCKQHVKRTLSGDPTGSELQAAVSRAIRESMTKGAPTLKRVATTLAVSPRTLERRLKDHGIMFKVCVSEMRRKIAFEYLNDSERSLAEIAFLLFYSELSAFSRAFKRWTGVTPQRYRLGKRRPEQL